MKKRIFSFMLALVMVCSLLPINILAASGYTTCASGTVSWQMIYDGPETYYWIDGDGEYCKLTATKSGSKYYVTLYRSAKSNGTELRYLRQDKSDDSGSAHEWSSASTKYTGGVLYKTGESGTGTGSGSDSGSGTGTDSGSTAAIIADGTYTATSNSTYKKDSETYSATVTITVSGGKITSVTGSGPVTSSDNKSYFNKTLSGIQSQLVNQAATANAADGVDTVSKATNSSKLIKEAAQLALGSAPTSGGTGTGSGSETDTGTGSGTGSGDSIDVTITNPAAATENDLSLTKELIHNSDDTYSIRLTAYAIKGAATSTSGSDYIQDGYGKEYTYSTLKNGGYYYLLNGNYYAITADTSGSESKKPYIAYFKAESTTYYLEEPITTKKSDVGEKETTKTIYESRADKGYPMLYKKYTGSSTSVQYVADAASKAKYTYNVLKNGGFYYHYNNTYYEVQVDSSGSRDYKYAAYFLVGSTKYWLTTGGSTTTSRNSSSVGVKSTDKDIYESSGTPLYTLYVPTGASSGSGNSIGTGAVLKDTINTANFNTSAAVVTITSGNGTKTFNQTSGLVTVTGYDYTGNYNGTPLVVTISGLTAKKTGSNLTSNSGNAGVYESSSASSALVSVASPTVTIPETQQDVPAKADGVYGDNSTTVARFGYTPIVAVTVENGKITDITADADTNDMNLSFLEDTVNAYKAQLIGQPASAVDDIDTVSGATYASTAVRAELQQALSEEPKGSYTVRWLNEDGSALETDSNVKYGTRTSYDGVDPTKAEDANYQYTFKEWNPSVSTFVTANVDYTAAYDSTEKAKAYELAVEDITYDLATGESTGASLVIEEDGVTYVWPTAVLKENGVVKNYTTNEFYISLRSEDETIAESKEKDVWFVLPENPGETYLTMTFSKYLNGTNQTEGTQLVSARFKVTVTAPETAAEDGKYIDGTETVQNFNYVPTVSVVVEDGVIKGVTAAANTSTINNNFLNKALIWVQERVADQPATAATLDGVDTVSGATYATQTILNAAKKALEAEHTISWVDDDDTLLDIAKVTTGTLPPYGGTEPAKAGYDFTGWTPEVTAVSGNATYQATYATKYADGVYGDNSVTVQRFGYAPITAVTVENGIITDLTADADTSAKNLNYLNTALASYKEQLIGQPVSAANDIDTVSGATLVSAAVKEELQKALSEDPKGPYTVRWLNGDGSILETDSGVTYGTRTSYDGAAPSQDADSAYTYEFNGWTPVVSTFVTVDAAYQAVYDAQVKSYGISFVPGAVDVTNLPTEQTATVGQIVTINEEPKRTGYAFDGWTSEDTEVTGNTFTMPAQDVTLTAQWTRDDSQTQDVHYTVIHDVDGSEAFLQQYHDTAWINEENPVIAITELDIAAQKYRGYALTGTEPEVLPANGDTVPTGTVLKVYYTKSTPTWTWEKNEDGDCIAAATFTYHDGSTETIDAAVTSSVTKEATCTENGEVLYTATAIIGTEEYTTTYTEAIPATHTLTKVEAKAATCEADGSIEYYICEVCGKLFADGEATAEITSEDTIVPAMGHDWDEGVVTTPATCEEDGVKTYTCKHDPSHTYTEVIPALGHEWGENGGACIRCGEEFPAKITSVNAKQMSEMVTAQVIVGEAKGKAVTYSIRQYADVVFGQTSAVYEKMKPLLRAMLNYGGYAQQYFGYNLDRLANAGLYETDTDPVLNEETPDLSKYASEKTVTEDTKGIQLMSASVLVDSETELRFYFGLEEGKTMDDYTFQLKNSTKELVCEEDAKGNHYVSIKGIKATELSSMFTVIVTPKEETEPAITFSYGVLTYVKTQLEYSKKENTINMVKALYQYAQAAAAYVSKK